MRFFYDGQLIISWKVCVENFLVFVGNMYSVTYVCYVVCVNVCVCCMYVCWALWICVLFVFVLDAFMHEKKNQVGQIMILPY